MKIVLKRNYFTDKETVFLEAEDLKVSLFKFETDVEAVRVQNEFGYIIVLPFKGQEIWEASFNGRIINMYRVGKHAPKKNGALFLDSSYGVFFFHCGALRMGCPAIDDDHVLHGELPYADYDEAELIIGTDGRGFYAGVTGKYIYNRGFGPCYEAHPVAKLYSNSTVIEIGMRIDNLSNYPMELMYMAHLNFRPIPHSRIVQCNPWTEEDMPLREYIPSHLII